MPTFKARALVLRRIPLGEKDKIVTLFTREYGKLRAVAKGARLTTSRLSGATEPLIVIQALLSEGTRLDVVSQAEVRESFPALRAEYGSLVRASYLCELVDRVTEERDPHPQLFDLAVSTLYLLSGARQPDAVLHAAELQMLSMIGYEPRLDACARCERPFGPDRAPVAFSPLRGGALCEDCGDAAREETIPCGREIVAALDRLSLCDDARELLALSLPEETMGRVNRILREHLRLRLERDIRSTAFLDAVRLEGG